MKILILYLTFVAVASAGRIKVDDRIVNGADVPEGRSIPWQVSLQRIEGNRHFCGGSVIGAQFVMSAAHCVSAPENNHVLAGTDDLSKTTTTGQIGHILTWIGHPGFSFDTLDYDYSIIKLKEPFVLNQWVTPIPLPEQDEEFSGEAYTSGWGLNDKPGGEIPDELQVTALPLISNAQCQLYWGAEVNITNQMVCAGAEGKTSCSGDSGGPLFVRRGNGYDAKDCVLVGNVSFGTFLCRPTSPGAYSRNAAVRDWIDSNMK